MGWRWPDFWGFLMSDGKEGRKKEPPGLRKLSFRWGTPGGKVIMVAVILVLFGGLAVWIIVHVVRFFGGFWGMADDLTR